MTDYLCYAVIIGAFAITLCLYPHLVVSGIIIAACLKFLSD